MKVIEEIIEEVKVYFVRINDRFGWYAIIDSKEYGMYGEIEQLDDPQNFKEQLQVLRDNATASIKNLLTKPN